MRYAITTLSVTLTLASCGPSDFEKEKLAFEQQKYRDEQAAKAEIVRKEEVDKTEQKTHWVNCRVSADSDFNNEFKNWGDPVPGRPGIRNGNAHQYEEMQSRLQRKKEQCDRNFPKGISW